MGITSLQFGRSQAADAAKKLGLDQRKSKEKTVECADDNIDDGPVPWWSGFVWIPLFLFSLCFFAGLAFAVWRVFS